MGVRNARLWHQFADLSTGSKSPVSGGRHRVELALSLSAACSVGHVAICLLGCIVVSLLGSVVVRLDGRILQIIY